MTIQMELITTLKQENTTLKAKLKKHADDTMDIELGHKRIWEIICRIKQSNTANTNNDSTAQSTLTITRSEETPTGYESYHYHPQGSEWLHPLPVVTKRVHRVPISLIHSQELEPT